MEKGGSYIEVYKQGLKGMPCNFLKTKGVFRWDKRRKCLATGSEELSSLSVCAPKWRFMTSLAKNILRFSPFWALKSKPPSQLATKGSEKLASFFQPIREEHRNNNGDRRLRREHLRRIIAAPQWSTFFASCVCLAKTRKVAFRSEESSSLPSKVRRQNTAQVVLWDLTFSHPKHLLPNICL